jgi:hypothetical protein
MTRSFEYRNGRLKVQRIGVLAPQRQRNFNFSSPEGNNKRGRNRRAPEKRGIWCFVFPYFDAYMASFQAELVLPTRLRSPIWHQLQQEREALETSGGTAQQLADINDRIEQLFAEREQAYKSPAVRKRLQVREFWVSGNVYTHLGKGAADSEWSLMPVSQLAELLPKVYAKDARAAEANIGANGKRYHHSNWPLSTDHLELFLGRGATIH